jgi:branched-chain amino acid transport system substrate-binding protein
MIIILLIPAIPSCARGGAEEKLKVGIVYPLTGALEATGKDLKNGILLAIDTINNEYDLGLLLARSKGIPSLRGRKIEVVFGDSQGDPDTGASEVEKLITQEKVAAIIGCYQSAVTKAASAVAERHKIPYLTACSTAPVLSDRGFKWFFRVTPDANLFARNSFVFLEDLKQKRGIEIQTIAIVHENTEWGTSMAEAEVKYAREYGYEIAEIIPYLAKATDVTGEVERLKAANPDVVLQASYISDAILTVKTYKEMDFSPKAVLADAVGFTAPAFLEALGKDGNYFLTREVWSLDLTEKNPLIKQVNDMFRSRFGTNMSGDSSRSLTAMLVLANAIDRAGSIEPLAAQKALLETDIPAGQLVMTWDGVRFDEKHDNVLGRSIICQILDQEYRTVWPFHVASEEIVWPVPMWRER